jgi:hypothetical protein
MGDYRARAAMSAQAMKGAQTWRRAQSAAFDCIRWQNP